MTNAIAIRPATPEDADAVARVLASSYPRLLAPAYDAVLLASVLPLIISPNQKLLASGTYYLAIVDNGEEIGCGGWTRERPGTGEIEPGLGHIRHFGVHADWAGHGVGRKLFDRCLADAREAGVVTFESYATLNGEPFYKALGFQAERRIDVPVAADLVLPSILMRRAL